MNYYVMHWSIYAVNNINFHNENLYHAIISSDDEFLYNSLIWYINEEKSM